MTLLYSEETTSPLSGQSPPLQCYLVQMFPLKDNGLCVRSRASLADANPAEGWCRGI